MDFIEIIIICTFFLTCVTVVTSVARTIIEWRLLRGSDKYWRSWKSRSKNIRKKLLKELTDEMLKYELKRRAKRKKKE